MNKRKIIILFILMVCAQFTNGQYLNLNLSLGLNNQKIGLLGACRMVNLNKLILIEPYFQPFLKKEDKPILLSEIFDFEYFKTGMSQYLKIIPYTDLKNANVKITNIDQHILWGFLEAQEGPHSSDKGHCFDDLEIAFFKSLKLNKRFENMIEENLDLENGEYVAIHCRIEDDWLNFSKDIAAGFTGLPRFEKIYFTKEEILNKYLLSEFKECKKIYLSTYYDKEDLVNSWIENGYIPYRFDTPDLNYHISSAIDFEICVNAKYFIGHSRSTFSSMVARTRYSRNKGNSYIYNMPDDKLHLYKNIYIHASPDEAV